MENKLSIYIIILGTGLAIGAGIIAISFFVLGLNPRAITIFGVEFDISIKEEATQQEKPTETLEPTLTVPTPNATQEVSITFVVPQSGAGFPLDEHFFCKSGEFAPQDLNQLVEFNYSLNEDEFIIGQCTEFSGYNMYKQGGVAYVIQGPGLFTWSTKHGWWDVCPFLTEQDLQNKLDWQAHSLEINGNTATGIARRIICSYSGEQVNCVEK